ncbi:MAG: glycoside-pentoside-hexuronide (GPH):cation symporter [Eubacteriales bacterium]|nr:glycoside-pentoside-hexuronide (GPH):cation symporter [Eubacteriales bacterium]
MSKAIDQTNRVVSLREKIAYGITEIACNPMYTIFCSFLVYFYTDVIGVNPAAVGTIILVSRIFDGFSDVIAGNLVEHTHARSGSARPWILRIAIPLGVSYVAMFTVPDCGEWGKLVYIFVSYNVVQSVVYTMANAAMSALPTYMTGDRNSRSSCYAVRLFIAAATQTVLSLKFMNIIEAMGGGQQAWVKLAAILGTIAAVIFIIVYFTTRETVTSGGENGEDVPLLVGLKALMHNKYWFLVLALQFCCVLHQVTTLTVGVYYAKYILNDAKLVGNIIMYHHFPALVVMLLLPMAIDRGVSKRLIAILSSISMLLGSAISVVYAAGFPFVISMALRGIGFGGLSSVLYGMLADTVEYGEWKTGVRTQAINVTANGVGQKIGSGLGTAAFGAILTMCGYNGMAEVQTASAVSCIRIIFIMAPIVIYLVMLVLSWLFKLDKQFPQIQKELQERKQRTRH